MPMGDKYIELTHVLKNSKQNTIEMTFDQVKHIVGDLPSSAYQYPTFWSFEKHHSICYAWLNAGYSAKADIKKQTIIFYKDSDSNNSL